ncbi:Gfo/Idh/MocA family oxidoreductase [Mesorhizobium sp. M5C.F.Ca.IN.020.29.1.1]|uniref:Gfo/Idh/MocA family protein n=1 Tax=Mesorhizobium sp. M5C.F.Ca.IN.020.29.1.1 TaxID=2496770 RepID=UPI000FCB3A4B|nr:Gfo/Idh/MocA family oxidoreductase [Mesorhizobium sp. M5C.F.Ca.IN.020.29.1.1]RUV53900.1 Gfo/Idh/MocA family oxidoreductase [Mesorhizobium sp. M5C.F.Ca.IN.020.29.1.1]
MKQVEPLRAAIVGVGRAEGMGIGYCHARTYRSTPGFELVAAADIDADHLKNFREKFDVIGYLSIEGMLNTKPDVVSICTYVGLHFRMIKACVAAGVRGIVCEKPFVASPTELKELRALIAASGTKIIVPHYRRYMKAFARARDIFASGEIGERLVVTAAIGDGWDLSEWGSHWFDMFRFFHDDNMPEWVLAQARVTNRRFYGHAMEDHAVAYMEFPGGGRAVLETGIHYLNDGVTMALTGSRGAIVVLAEDKLRVYSSSGAREENYEDADSLAWSAMFADLRDWINTGKPAPLGFNHVAGTAELNLGSYLSMIEGDRVDFPLKHHVDEWPVEELARRHASK